MTVTVTITVTVTFTVKVEPLQLEGLGSVERHRLELARAVSLFRLSQVNQLLQWRVNT